MLRRWVAPGLCLGGLGCSLLVPLDDLANGAPDAGAPRDASVDQTARDAEVDAPSCVTDTQTDGKNCGRCGHDCLGGKCAAGVCQVSTVLTGLVSPWHVYANETHLFVTSTQMGDGPSVPRPLVRVDRSTLQAADLLPAGASAWDVAFDGKTAFVSGNGRIYTVADGATSARALPSDELPALTGIALTPTRVYVASYGSNVLIGVPRAGGASVFTTVIPNVETIPTDGKYVYVGEQADRKWSRLDKSSNVRGAWVETPSSMRRSRLDGTTLYWMSGDGTEWYTTDTATGVTTSHALPGHYGIGDLVTNATHVFLSTRSEGIVYRIPKSDLGKPEVYLRDQAGPVGLFADASSLFWVNQKSGEVERLAF